MSIARNGEFFESTERGIYDYGFTNTSGGLTVSDGSVFVMTGGTSDIRGATMGVGSGSGAVGTVTVTGAGSTIDMRSVGNPNDVPGVTVGRDGGTGSFTVTDGGAFTMTEPNNHFMYFRVGNREGSDGTARIASDGQFTMTSAGGLALDIGVAGATGLMQADTDAQLDLNATGNARAVELNVGLGVGANGTAGSGRLEVTGGADIALSGESYAFLSVGTNGGTGDVLIDSASLTLSAQIDAFFRIGTRFTDTENNTGTGTMELRNGATVTVEADSDFSSLFVGGGADSNGSLSILSGSVLDMGGRAFAPIGRAQQNDAPGGEGQVLVDGDGSELRGVRELLVGTNGSQGTANLRNGGLISLGDSGSDTFTLLFVGGGPDSMGALTIDAARMVIQASDGRNSNNGQGWEAYSAVGEFGGSGALIINGARAIDPDSQHGLVQTGGDESPFNIFDVGRGGTGAATIAGGILGSENDGGRAGMRIGLAQDSKDTANRPGTGTVTVEDDGLLFIRSAARQADGAEVEGSFLSIGIGASEAGQGELILDGGDLDLESVAFAFMGVGQEAGGEGRFEMRNGAEARIMSTDGHDATLLAGLLNGNGAFDISGAGTRLDITGQYAGLGLGGTGGVGLGKITDGAAVTIKTDDLPDADMLASAALILGWADGAGALEISGAGTAVSVLGANATVQLGYPDALTADEFEQPESGAGLLHVADDAVLRVQGSVQVGRPAATDPNDPGDPAVAYGMGNAALVLEDGRIDAPLVQVNPGQGLAGTGTLGGFDGAGMLDMQGAELRIGDTFAGIDSLTEPVLELVAATGRLQVMGDVVLDTTQSMFDIAPDAHDSLHVAGHLTLSGGAINLNWIGGDASLEGAIQLMTASDGIDLSAETTVVTPETLDGTVFLKGGDTELWFAPDGLVNVYSIAVADLFGIASANTSLRFSPVGDGDPVLDRTDATGMAKLTLPVSSAGRITASRDYDPGADPTISALDALDVLRLAVGIAPSFGPAQAQNYIAADINSDGAVTALDALEVLRAAVGINSAHSPRWAFFDAATDWDELEASRAAVNAPETGIDLSGVVLGADLAMIGILLGNMEGAVFPGTA